MLEFIKLALVALVLTIAVEVGVAWLFRLRSKSAIVTVILINVVTNLLLNYILLINNSLHLIGNTLALMLSLEAVVVLAEWRLLLWVLKQNKRKMLVLALFMNICSYLAGLLVFTYL